MLFFYCGKTFASWPFLKFHISGEDATKCSISEFEDLTCVTSLFSCISAMYVFGRKRHCSLDVQNMHFSWV